MNALLLLVSLVASQTGPSLVDVRGGTIELRDLQTGAVTQFAVNASGPLAYDPFRNRVVYASYDGSTHQLRSLNLGTGATSLIEYLSRVPQDIEVDPNTGITYLVEPPWGIYYAFPGGKTWLFLSDSSARNVEVDPLRGDVWYTVDYGSTLKRRTSGGTTTTVLSLGWSDFITDFVVDEANARIIWAQDGASGQLLRSAAFDGSGVAMIRALSNSNPANMCASYQLSLDDAGAVLYASCTTTIETIVLATNTNTELVRVSGTSLFSDVDVYHARPVATRLWAPINPTEYMTTNISYRSTGFVITTTANVLVRSLGAFVNSSHAVRLWDNATGTELVSAVVTGPSTGAPAWTYTSIPLFELIAGRSYTLSVDGGPGNTFTYFPWDHPNYPIASGAVVFEDAVEAPYGHPNSNSMRPTVTYGGWMAGGIPDLVVMTR